jgi:hypothetical protein
MASTTPYTVLIDGYPVLCDSPAAAVALAREAARTGATVGGNPRSSVEQGGTPGSRWSEQRIAEFFNLIKGNQRKLIDALLETPDGRTDVQLLTLLSLSDGRSLAGVLAGLWKNAKKVGADPRDLYTRSPVTIGDRTGFEYSLVDAFRKAASQRRAK